MLPVKWERLTALLISVEDQSQELDVYERAEESKYQETGKAHISY